MTGRTLELTATDLGLIRTGFTVMVTDSDGRSVDVSMHTYPCDGRPRLTLSVTDLDMVETPEGLTCASDDGEYGWKVRMAEVPA